MVQFGTSPSKLTSKSASFEVSADSPKEIVLDRLKPNKQYYFRLRFKKSDQSKFSEGATRSFHTQRPAGQTFTFEVQGDSHPERPNMFLDELYRQTLRAAAKDRPDFYMTIGDDFSVDEGGRIDRDSVHQIYLRQRKYLALVDTPIFLVNGNHEQAAGYLLDGTGNNVAVWAQTARNSLFSLPSPGKFYSGDTKPIEPIGLLRDYYAWTWGDALFVVIDPYWHSPIAVDVPYGMPSGPRSGGPGGPGGPGGQSGPNRGGGASESDVSVDSVHEVAARQGRPPQRGQGPGRPRPGGPPPQQRDLWKVTLGDDQYQWLKKTLETSKAKYKLVFAHHVLGTLRGGIEAASMFEWGGQSRNGVDEFKQHRPTWELPIHQLMVKNKVSIFFQGHDHLFAHQERDGVVYQTLPVPADPFYGAGWRPNYRSGDILPCSGRVRVGVSSSSVKVEYIRSFLAKDATKEHPNGEVAFSYRLPSP